MDKLKQEISNYLLLKYGFSHEVYCEPEHSEYFSWIPVFNNEFYNLKPVPPFFYKRNKELLELDKNYSFVTENKYKFNRFDYHKYKVESLAKLLHEVTHKWFNYHVDEDLYAGNWHGKPFRDLMKNFGIMMDQWGNYLEILDSFRKLVRDADPRNYRQF